jgi:hypothetical protein
MIHTAELDLEQFGQGDVEGRPEQFWLDVFNYWVDNGYPIDSLLEAYSVVHKKQDSEDTAHVVLEVQTLSKPKDMADIVADETTMYACDCKGYQYHYYVDLDEKRLLDWGYCPHIDAVDPTVKAENDESQQTL